MEKNLTGLNKFTHIYIYNVYTFDFRGEMLHCVCDFHPIICHDP